LILIIFFEIKNGNLTLPPFNILLQPINLVLITLPLNLPFQLATFPLGLQPFHLLFQLLYLLLHYLNPIHTHLFYLSIHLFIYLFNNHYNISNHQYKDTIQYDQSQLHNIYLVNTTIRSRPPFIAVLALSIHTFSIVSAIIQTKYLFTRIPSSLLSSITITLTIRELFFTDPSITVFAL